MERKLNLGQKIEQLLKMTSMTKVELSKKLGLRDSSVVSHWVKNRFKPDRDNIVKLSHVFEKPVSYFTDDTYTAQDSDQTNCESKIYELLSNMPSGRYVGVLNEINDEFFTISYYCQPEEYLPVMLEAKQQQPFALKVAAQAACPWAKKGEYLIFCPVSQLPNGKLAIVKVDGMLSIKKVYFSGGKITLEDFRKKVKRFPKEKVEIIAQLLAFYRKP